MENLVDDVFNIICFSNINVYRNLALTNKKINEKTKRFGSPILKFYDFIKSSDGNITKSYYKNKRTGQLEYLYEEWYGKTKIKEFTFVDGKRHGICTEWDGSGMLYSKVKYRHDVAIDGTYNNKDEKMFYVVVGLVMSIVVIMNLCHLCNIIKNKYKKTTYIIVKLLNLFVFNMFLYIGNKIKTIINYI
ncbi:Transmembrane domain-containing protein [Orpheovirus IHUMI-LCC2]|uniref:Transmembrane domain-containing protein n=1 Tax=Orpheovirus IHUMI-LCC2 TaxID=2023057 RepID=A0A2I2L549_9VIRU|nr:Transmembrane domain-containing protein [Orpheovirus IHUMI-LCC2]SNW62654.1 Transmembrane domain-containing protein [Orpheovirus IHUMI-LCC2]